jgi:hypothetical protein
MHLVYIATLAFLIAEVHYIRGNVPQPRPLIIQAAFCAPKISVQPAGPALAAEEENRAPAPNDGVRRRGCTGKATGSRFPDPRQLASKIWKPWLLGGS